MEAFSGESQARNKYTYFAHIAQREGYDQLSELFLKTARNEQEHARIWYEELGHLGATAENLLLAAEGEETMWEWRKKYRPISTAPAKPGQLSFLQALFF